MGCKYIVNKNKLLISAAGAGKTTLLVDNALKSKKKILITTYTQSNEAEIRKKFVEKVGYIPSNVTIQTWFSFLIQHGVKPYQSYIFDIKINGMLLVNKKSGVKYYNQSGIPVCYKEEEDAEKYYLTDGHKIYSDKLSKLVQQINKKSNGAVIERLEKIFEQIFIDEVQDLAGYDLEIIKSLFLSKAMVILAGDPRQVVYLSHLEAKYKKYRDGNIREFVLTECKKDVCEIDESSLNASYRNNSKICDFSFKLYPDFPKCKSHQTAITGHDGVFIIKEEDLNEYLIKYKPVQLIHSKAKKVSDVLPVYNFGESKGLTFDRVIIYPTEPIKKWLKDNNSQLESTSRSKFYVAITRARYSVAIVYNKDDIKMANIKYYVSPE